MNYDSYDNWKLQTPPRGNPVELNAKCKCGRGKFIADNFCGVCQKEWELKFKKKK